MKYYIHTDNNKLNGHGICKTSDSSIEVTEEIYNDYSQNPLKYTLKDNKAPEPPKIGGFKLNNAPFELEYHHLSIEKIIGLYLENTPD